MRKIGKPKDCFIEGYEAFNFYGRRQEDPIPSDKETVGLRMVWCVYEASTGLAGSWGDTLKEAAANTKQFIDMYGGPDWLKKRLSSRPKVMVSLFGD